MYLETYTRATNQEARAITPRRVCKKELTKILSHFGTMFSHYSKTPAGYCFQTQRKFGTE